MRKIDLIVPVRNGGNVLIRCICGWLSQKVPEGWEFNIIIIDDASSDGCPQLLLNSHPERIAVITNPVSLGRGHACNVGAGYSVAEFIIISDADCLPNTNEVLFAYLDKATSKIDLIFGGISAEESGFWGRYYNQVTLKRSQSFIDGNKFSLTTQNCLISRKKFNAINGFDLRYTEYGFEDRDLIARAVNIGCICIYEEKAMVLHCDRLQLASICRKMNIAGQYTAQIFRASHPKIYNKMLFSKVDVNCHKYLKAAVFLLNPIKHHLLQAGIQITQMSLPYPIKAITVKVLSGIFFMLGTNTSRQQQ